MQKWIWPGLMLLGGCGFDPKGSWGGTIEFEAEDGDSYVNELVVAGDFARVTLYSLVDGTDPETDEDVLYIAISNYTGTWTRGDDVTFDLVCDWDDCTTGAIMDCIVGDGGDVMICDAWPDIYASDTEVLQWVREN